jgi:DNA ligase-1
MTLPATIRPMLSAKLERGSVQFPVLVSAKIDGIRCVMHGGRPTSRTGKILPNLKLRLAVRKYKDVLEGLDGEIVVGPPAAPNVYNKTMSGIMSEGTDPDFTYLVFDWIGEPQLKYHYRYRHIRQEMEANLPPWCQVLPQTICRTLEELEAAEEEFIAKGYEGIIVRSPNAPYKFGRSTVKQGYLLKLKRYEDSEAKILGFDELYANENPAYFDEQGFTRHTSHKAGQVAKGTLGALQVSLLADPAIRFNIGTGFDMSTRDWFWAHRDVLLGKIVKFKYMPHGVLESTGVPRHPVYLGLRDPIDL